MPAATETSALPELTFTRTFEAPRELVFKVWTDPYHVAQWWGPHGYTIPVSRLDPRPGGLFEVHMLGADGLLLPCIGEFRETVAPRRIVFTSNLVAPDGRNLIEALNTITLDEEGQTTRMTLHIKVLSAVPEVADKLGEMEEGWNQSLERFEAELIQQMQAGQPG
jgi:uncharacterized protein YndB with AHSA1/START domain